jgi:hypothetical protein
MLGSLDNFISIDTSSFHIKTEGDENTSNENSQVENLRKRIQRTRRTSLNEYRASDKSPIITCYTQKFIKTSHLQTQKYRELRNTYFINRKPISQGKVPSFFHKENPNTTNCGISKDSLKR